MTNLNPKLKSVKGWTRDYTWGNHSIELQFTNNMNTAASWFEMGYDLYWAELKILKKLGATPLKPRRGK